MEGGVKDSNRLGIEMRIIWLDYRIIQINMMPSRWWCRQPPHWDRFMMTVLTGHTPFSENYIYSIKTDRSHREKIEECSIRYVSPF